MQEFETKALEPAHLKPKTWLRYVDNTYGTTHGRNSFPDLLEFLTTH